MGLSIQLKNQPKQQEENDQPAQGEQTKENTMTNDRKQEIKEAFKSTGEDIDATMTQTGCTYMEYATACCTDSKATFPQA